MANQRERELIRAIQMGSEEEAVEAIREFTGNSGGAAHDSVAYNFAVRQFAESNPGIAVDPILFAAAAQMDTNMTAAGDRRPYAERYSDIAERITEWCERHGVNPATDESELDASRVIEEMRQSRANGRDLDDPEYQWR
ncbi:MAG TPA: hypothetical protein VKC56_07255 [Gallionellaceae bacterium]|nr:hypothetical protein [Gallionellaceae bacterium]